MDNDRLNKSPQAKNVFLFLMVMTMGVMFALAVSGVMARIDHAVAQYAKASAGYVEKVYLADTKSYTLEAMPVMGAGYLEQPIYLSKEMCESGQVMLGLYMAAYERKNTGKLYAACIQENEEKTFVMDMEEIKDNSEIKLLFSTENFQEGYLHVKLYAPQSSGENCVALYAVGNTNTYLPLCVNGEQTEKMRLLLFIFRLSGRAVILRKGEQMKLIIQIPCYNEAETLEISLNDLPRRIDGIDTIEYLIINDGSKDNTVEVAKRWGVHYVVNFAGNKGLAKGFMAGIDACLRNGADIIVNTDADNQYCGSDIEKLVRPIIEGKADIIIGERPIDQTEHFSPLKKRLQHLGSWVVQKASNTDIPDAPSGFRAYSREAAMRLNVTNEYTYTLETIVQAGREKITMDSVPVKTNAELRPSRLFNSMFGYVKKSMLTIVRAFIMYKPLQFFTILGSVPFLIGLAAGIRFLVYLYTGQAGGHVQSLILAGTLLMMGFMTYMIGLQADIIAANRKILEDVQYQVRRLSYDGLQTDSCKNQNEPADEKLKH